MLKPLVLTIAALNLDLAFARETRLETPRTESEVNREILIKKFLPIAVLTEEVTNLEKCLQVDKDAGQKHLKLVDDQEKNLTTTQPELTLDFLKSLYVLNEQNSKLYLVSPLELGLLGEDKVMLINNPKNKEQYLIQGMNWI